MKQKTKKVNCFQQLCCTSLFLHCNTILDDATVNPFVKLTLPILTGALALSLAEKKPITEHQIQFIDVHRDHLLSL